MTSWYGNAFRITDPCGESTGHIRSQLYSLHKGPVVQTFVVSFAVCLNKLLNKQSSCRLFGNHYSQMMIACKYRFYMKWNVDPMVTHRTLSSWEDEPQYTKTNALWTLDWHHSSIQNQPGYSNNNILDTKVYSGDAYTLLHEICPFTQTYIWRNLEITAIRFLKCMS